MARKKNCVLKNMLWMAVLLEARPPRYSAIAAAPGPRVLMSKYSDSFDIVRLMDYLITANYGFPIRGRPFGSIFSCVRCSCIKQKWFELMMIRARAWAARIHNSKSYIKICRSDVAFAVSVKLSPQIQRPNAHTRAQRWQMVGYLVANDHWPVSYFPIQFIIVIGWQIVCGKTVYLYLPFPLGSRTHIHDRAMLLLLPRARVRMTHGKKIAPTRRRVWGLFDYAVVIRKQCAQTQAANGKASMPWQKGRQKTRPTTISGQAQPDGSECDSTQIITL